MWVDRYKYVRMYVCIINLTSCPECVLLTPIKLVGATPDTTFSTLMACPSVRKSSGDRNLRDCFGDVLMLAFCMFKMREINKEREGGRERGREREVRR